MSIQFNDTENLRGIVQLYAEEIGLEDITQLTGNTTKMKQLTARVNNALDTYFNIAVQASGTWQLDDSNHQRDPIIKTNLVAGQRSYYVLKDQNNNTVLDIYRVFVKNSSTGKYEEIFPVDTQSDSNTYSLTDGSQTQGSVYRYDKTGNGIFLDLVPAEDIEEGLLIYINRESSYFTYTDTTKTPGYPYHQEYFFIKPACEYARRHNLTSLPRLEELVYKYEGDKDKGVVGLIASAYCHREKDVRKKITNKKILYI